MPVRLRIFLVSIDLCARDNDKYQLDDRSDDLSDDRSDDRSCEAMKTYRPGRYGLLCRCR